MFGYIKPFKPQMRICEYDTYKAVYCGLCKQLGGSYGLAARFTLSYDFAFLSILSMALEEDSPSFCKERCFANPFKKKVCCRLNQSSQFSACTAMVMLYHKVEDNYRDSGIGGKLLMLLAKPFAASARKKALLQYPVLDEMIGGMMKRQFALEQAGCTSIDEAAEPTAACLGQVFALLGKEDAQRRVLQRMGYLLGRWVYLMDAVDDLEGDLKSGSYNVFVIAGTAQPDSPEDLRTQTAATLNQTAAEIAKTYELLNLYRYQPILDNIIYLGLKNALNLIEAKKEQHA